MGGETSLTSHEAVDTSRHFKRRSAYDELSVGTSSINWSLVSYHMPTRGYFWVVPDGRMHRVRLACKSIP